MKQRAEERKFPFRPFLSYASTHFDLIQREKSTKAREKVPTTTLTHDRA